jgi:hypothetical protein
VTLAEILILRARLLYARRVLFPVSHATYRLGINLDAKGRRILAEIDECLRTDRPGTIPAGKLTSENGD